MSYTSPTQVFRVGYYPWENKDTPPQLKVGDLVVIVNNEELHCGNPWRLASRIDSDTIESHGVMLHWLTEYRGTVL
jgi:hypothetical protein